MKKNIVLVLLTIMTLCMVLSSTTFGIVFSFDYTSKAKRDNLIVTSNATKSKSLDIINELDKSLLKNYLDELVEYGPRNQGGQGCNGAAEYIYEQFRRMGLQVKYHNWTDFGNNYHFGYYSGSNIEGTLEGINTSSDKIIVFNAHYDTVKNTVGADDDGSGVAAVLAAASVLSRHTFEHTLKFVMFSGEEVGLLGSNAYAKEAYLNNENIILEINADMIGHAKELESEKRFRMYGTEDIDYILSEIETINTESNILFNFTRGYLSGRSGGSDYYSFVKYGFESIAFFEYEWNEHMHSPLDNIENVNFNYLLNTTKIIAGAMAYIGDDTHLLPLSIFDSPKRGKLYINNNEIRDFADHKTVVIGDITISIKHDNVMSQPFSKVEFYFDDERLYTDTDIPFEYTLVKRGVGKHNLKIITYKENVPISSDTIEIMYVNLFGE